MWRRTTRTVRAPSTREPRATPPTRNLAPKEEIFLITPIFQQPARRLEVHASRGPIVSPTRDITIRKLSSKWWSEAFALVANGRQHVVPIEQPRNLLKNLGLV